MCYYCWEGDTRLAGGAPVFAWKWRYDDGDTSTTTIAMVCFCTVLCFHVHPFLSFNELTTTKTRFRTSALPARGLRFDTRWP
jgi:hypothetical protein